MQYIESIFGEAGMKQKKLLLFYKFSVTGAILISTPMNIQATTYQSRVGVATILNEQPKFRVGIAEEIWKESVENTDNTEEDTEEDIVYLTDVMNHDGITNIVSEEGVVVIVEEDTSITNRWNLTFSAYEIDLIAKIAWLESGNQSNDGQQAVITVILNRVASPLFPNTVEDVLSQKNPVQFTTWAKLNKAKPDEKIYNNLYAVIEGKGNDNITRNNWLYFNGVGPRKAVVIGDHKFW